MSAAMGPVFAATLQTQLLLAFGVVVGTGLFGHGFALWRRRRRIEDTPTSKVRSLSLGRAELAGRARGRQPPLAPISGTPCVLFRFRVEQEERRGRSRSWRTLASGVSERVAFELEDDTGRILVDPQGAELELEAQLRETNPTLTPALRELVGGRASLGSWWTGASRLRVSEERIHEGDPVYVLGLAQPRRDAAVEQRRAMAEELRALKADPAALARFDRDGDGRVDTDEWELARRDVTQRHAAVAPEDPVVIARDPRGDAPFVLSAFGERALVRRLFWRSLAEGLGGASLTLLSLAFLVAGRA